MKVGVLTFHRADNYGAMLQSIALVEAISSFGHDAEIIDYRCAAIENVYVYRLFPAFRLNFIAYTEKLLNNLKTVPKLRIKHKKCERFRKLFYKMSDSVLTEADRENAEREFDIIFTGSDQIWNAKLTHGKDDWYSFKRITQSCVVASYAASVGSINFFRKYYKLYEEDLQKYDFLSVRERNAKRFLAERIQRDIALTVDPTLLLDREFWERIACNTIATPESYVLYYDVDLNEMASSIAIDLASNKGIDIVYFGKMPKGNFKSICASDAGPDEFLGLIKDAKYVITSSFHATAFSVIFHKQFIAVPHVMTGERVRTFLCDVGLKSRLVENNGEFRLSSFDENIDWDSSHIKMLNMKTISYNYLTECINCAKLKSQDERTV